MLMNIVKTPWTALISVAGKKRSIYLVIPAYPEYSSFKKNYMEISRFLLNISCPVCCRMHINTYLLLATGAG